jgi:hypothetical protein
MNARNCYCPDDGTQPAYLLRRGVPAGFCGICDDCGQPGHTRHAPAPIPCTACWCDECYAKEEAEARENFKDFYAEFEQPQEPSA